MPITSQNFTVDNLDTSLRFSFRCRENYFSISIAVIGTSIFTFGLIFLFLFMPQRLSQTLQDWGILSAIFAFLLHLPYLLLWVVAITETFWMLNGKEIVVINSEGISIRHQIFSYGINKNFSAEIISCVFISRHKDSGFLGAPARELRFSSFNRGKIAFNSGKTSFGEVITFRFGSILDPEEAKQVIATIHRRFPQYICPAKSAG